MWTAFIIMTAILGILGIISAFNESEEGMGARFLFWLVGSGVLFLIWAFNEDSSKKAEAPENAKVVISQEIAKAYYEGQRDYAEGNIHIRDVNYDHCYHWESSPWKDMNIDSLPYNPECAQKKGE